ncbi:hypothetical protein ACM9W9_07315 [Xanthomonas sacchari]
MYDSIAAAVAAAAGSGRRCEVTAIAFLVFAPRVEVAGVRPIGKLFPRRDLAPQASVVPAVAT